MAKYKIEFTRSTDREIKKFRQMKLKKSGKELIRCQKNRSRLIVNNCLKGMFTDCDRKTSILYTLF